MKCICCGKNGSILNVCRECQKKYLSVDFTSSRCSNCGKKLISEEDLCFECRENRVLSSVDSVFPIFSYSIWKKDLLFMWKMQGARLYAFFFAKKIFEVYKQKFAGLSIVPIPPRPQKILKTGWDQIHDIQMILEFFYRVPIVHLLKRTEKEQQKKRNRQERLSHTGTDYVFEGKTVPESVVLIDDILTTGVTIETCSRILKKNGVKKVHAITVFIAS